MEKISNESRSSLTHSENKDFFSLEEIKIELENIKKRLFNKNSENKIAYEELNKLLEDLSCFDLGRFFIKNKGALSGYWTYYIILGYNSKLLQEKIQYNPLEEFLINKAPSILATKERFNKFQQLLSKNIKSNSVICSVPCGVMADLLTLNIPENISEIKFIGIDLDNTVFKTATKLAENNKQKNKFSYKFLEKDAWNLDIKNEFDAITSNGLNIYEKSDERVIDLYKGFINALKPGGYFIGSALSIPSKEWNFEKINKENLELQRKIFVTILEATWQNFRTVEKSKEQLTHAGFRDIEIHQDQQNIFYTFIAKKPILEKIEKCAKFSNEIN